MSLLIIAYQEIQKLLIGRARRGELFPTAGALDTATRIVQRYEERQGEELCEFFENWEPDIDKLGDHYP